MIYKDKNGTIAEVGDKVTGLYFIGNPDGVIIKDKSGELAVKDSDGDILTIESALASAIIIKKTMVH